MTLIFSPPPTWQALADAVEHFDPSKAEEIRREHLVLLHDAHAKYVKPLHKISILTKACVSHPHVGLPWFLSFQVFMGQVY